MTQLFYHATDIRRPEDVIPFLGKGERHWKKGRSAYELAYSWVSAGGIPASARTVLEQSEDFRDANLLSAFFEKETDLGSRGRPSQTDLLALCRCSAGIGVIGVEGKVDEPFGPFVHEWRDGSAGKEARLAGLRDLLGLNDKTAQGLRYQLLHRTAAALIEANSYRADSAMMLVHSFSAIDACFDDFQPFANALGMPVSSPNSTSTTRVVAGLRLTLGWVRDEVRQE